MKGVIVEGSDCSGKTTLINHLASKLSSYGWDEIDLRHRNGDQFERFLKAYINSERVLFDRAHFSEIVFGNLWRGGNQFNDWQLQILNKYSLENFIVVFAFTSEDILINRYKARKNHQVIKQEELIKVQNDFFNIFKPFKEKVVFYDSKDKKTLTSTVNNILKKLTLNSLMTLEIKSMDKIYNNKISITIDGVRYSGKSTLANIIQEKIPGFKVINFGRHIQLLYSQFLKEYVNNQKTIFDGGYISAIVGFENSALFNYEITILNEYTKNKLINFYCEPPIEKVIKWAQESGVKLNKTDIIKKRGLFLDYFKKYKLPILPIDTSNKYSIDNAIVAIKKFF